MTKVQGTGVYDFKRHRVAEYPVEFTEKPDSKPAPGSSLPSSITLSEIQRDQLTRIAAANWLKSGDSKPNKPFDTQLVKEIYATELNVKSEGKSQRKTVPLQRVMILEVSQYLENYLWPNFEAETASYEHVMSMILMFRENVAAWSCFYDRKDVFTGFLERVLRLKEGRDLTIAEKTNYLVFMINAFQSLEDEIVRETVLRLTSLRCWHSLSYGRFQMELCLNPDWIKKWKRMIKKESDDAKKQGVHLDLLSSLEVNFLRNLIEEFLEVLDHKVFSLKHSVNEDDELVAASSFEQIDDASILYCERFMEFLIDLLSQLPTRRYLRPLVADVAVVAKCHLSALYRHDKGKLFAQLVDLLQFYENFEINDHDGTQLTDDEVLQSHYDRLQSFQLLAFKKIPKLRELALANIGAIHKRADLSKKLSVFSPEELKDLVCCKFKLVSKEDPWSDRVDFLIEYVRGCEIIEIHDEEGTLMNDFSGRTKREEWKPPKGELRTVTVALDTAQYHMDVTDIAEKGAEDVYGTFNVLMRRKPKENNFKAILESIRDLVNEYCIVPDWLHKIFLGYGHPSAAQWRNMPDLLETVDFKDTFLNADHLKESFSHYQVFFVDSDGNGRSDIGSVNDANMVDACVENEKLIVEAYIPPDPDPYPQDQPKQNSVRFTPTQIGAIISGIQPGLTMVVGPPGTGKTDTARDVPARYLLRFGQGEQELATDLDFSRQGRVNAILVRRLELLSEVERLARSLQLPEDVGYTCETAGYFWLLHVYSRWEQFLAACAGNEDKPAFVKDIFPFKEFFSNTPQSVFTGQSFEKDMRAAKGCFCHLKTMFQELEECRAFELLKSTADRANYLMTKQAMIVAMTCTHAALKRKDFLQLGFKYDNLLMEESAQILVIETFIPMLLQRQEDGYARLKRCILIGDHHQLPPVVKNMAFQKYSHMDQSLFTRFVRLGIPYIELNAQGRARPMDVPDYHGRGETAPSPWFYQNEVEAEYVVSVYIYMRLLGYPANKISILTTYNGQKLLIRDVIKQTMLPWLISFKANKMISFCFLLFVLALLARFVGHLRDVRRLVVAMSRARLGLYVFCRRSLFEQCYELQPTFHLLFQRPDHLALNLDEGTSFTERHVEDIGHPYLISGVEEMANIVFGKINQLQQARAMYQYVAYSGQLMGTSEEQNSELNSISSNQGMDINTSVAEKDRINNEVHEYNGEEAKDADGLANGQDGVLPPEDQSNTEKDTKVCANDGNMVP
ncbi:hypothetical protein CRYUN_Cryun08bG0068700 [Craigia yunnanensis]